MKPHAIIAAILLTTASAHAEVCYPGGNAELRACLANEPDLVKQLAPGTWLIDPAGDQVLVNARSGLKIVALDPDDPPKIECTLGSDERPVDVPSNRGFTLKADAAVVQDVEVENLNFRNCAAGIVTFQAGGGRFENLSVHDLQVRNAYFGINLTGIKSARVFGNHVVDSDVGIQVSAPRPLTGNVEITDNFIVGNPDQVLKNVNLGIAVNNLNGVISDNSIRHFTRFFIRMASAITTGGGDSGGAFELDILDNEIRDVESGITTGGPVMPGTWVPSSTALGRIAGNDIRRYDRYAITAFHGAHGWTIGPNQFKDGPRNPFPAPDLAWNGDILLMVVGGSHPVLSPTLFGAGATDITVHLEPNQTVANPVPHPSNVID